MAALNIIIYIMKNGDVAVSTVDWKAIATSRL